jgi:hypothetical protein
MLPGAYDVSAVLWPGNCAVSYASKAAAAARVRAAGECGLDLRALAPLPMVSGAAEARRNCGACGGTATPARMALLPSVLRVLPPAARSMAELSVSFLRAAGELRLAPGPRADAVAALRARFPSGLTGLHLRRTDKVKGGARNAWDALITMTRPEADDYTARAMAYIATLPRPAHVYLATDDGARFGAYAAAVARAGGTVVNGGTDDPWLDLFMLAQCDAVVMASRYSTFATVAALLRRAPLVHFTPLNQTLLQLWAPLTVMPAAMPGKTKLTVGTGLSSWKELRWEPQTADYV